MSNNSGAVQGGADQTLSTDVERPQDTPLLLEISVVSFVHWLASFPLAAAVTSMLVSHPNPASRSVVEACGFFAMLVFMLPTMVVERLIPALPDFATYALGSLVWASCVCFAWKRVKRTMLRA